MQTEDKMTAYKILFKMLNGDQNENTEDDKTFRRQTKEEIIHRDQKYTELLNHFVVITKIRNVLKEFFKWSFYLMIILAFEAGRSYQFSADKAD